MYLFNQRGSALLFTTPDSHSPFESSQLNRESAKDGFFLARCAGLFGGVLSAWSFDMASLYQYTGECKFTFLSRGITALQAVATLFMMSLTFASAASLMVSVHMCVYIGVVIFLLLLFSKFLYKRLMEVHEVFREYRLS